MPLGNLTSQFFANVYLNELDQFVKHTLKAQFYIRYVDDFVFFHHNKETLEHIQTEIKNFLETIALQLHPDKSKIITLREGVPFLGYRIFEHHSLPRKSNLRTLKRTLEEKIGLVEENKFLYDMFLNSVRGWTEYAKKSNTFKMRTKLLSKISLRLGHKSSDNDLDRWLKAINSISFK